MLEQQSPLGKSTPDRAQLESLRAALADVSGSLERVYGLKTKLDAATKVDAAPGAEQDLRICQRAAALDRMIEEYEGRRALLQGHIELATGARSVLPHTRLRDHRMKLSIYHEHI